MVSKAVYRFYKFSKTLGRNAYIGVLFFKGRFHFCDTSKQNYQLYRDLYPDGFVGAYTSDVDVQDLIDDMKEFV